MYALKLSPAFKDYLWGGTKLRDEFMMNCDLEKIAEAWVLSCHNDGHSIIVNGEYKGLTLQDAIEKMGVSCLGTKGNSFKFFPILIKLIDAKQNLSIQVHPSDQYALEVEQEYGKTEMWYVVDCDKGAYIYYGFNRDVSKEEFRRRIEDGTLLDVLNRVEVKKGDCFFIGAGTIHAIGAGLLIAEIQQNSNTTYRVYDYGRVGADGNPRELHVSKALAVTSTDLPSSPVLHTNDSSSDIVLSKCDYFTTTKLVVNGKKTVVVSSESFSCLLCVSGEISFCDLTLKAGECAFLPANFGEVVITGTGIIIESRV